MNVAEADCTTHPSLTAVQPKNPNLQPHGQSTWKDRERVRQKEVKVWVWKVDTERKRERERDTERSKSSWSLTAAAFLLGLCVTGEPAALWGSGLVLDPRLGCVQVQTAVLNVLVDLLGCLQECILHILTSVQMTTFSITEDCKAAVV